MLRPTLVLCGLFALPAASGAATSATRHLGEKRQAQDLEDSIFQEDLDSLCPPGAITTPRAVPVITAQTDPTAVTVTIAAGAQAVWLINTYGTVIACWHSEAGKCELADATSPSTCTGTQCQMSWKDCWHKDVVLNYHLASEAIESVRAVAHYGGGDCQEVKSAPMKTWAYEVIFYENEVLDEDYVTSTPWEATNVSIAQMTPTVNPTINDASRTATVSMARLAGKPVPFLYVKDKDTRVLWYREFTTAEQGSTATYTSRSFAIPPVSTTLFACYPASIYKTQCSTVDLVEDILATFPAPSTTLSASLGTYTSRSAAADTYRVTPLPADYAACPSSYTLYATASTANQAGPAIGGIAVGSPLTLTITDASPDSINVFMACGNSVASMAVDLIAAKAAAPTDTGGDLSGNPPATELTCEDGERKDQETYSCDMCGSNQCKCEEGRTICTGSMPSGSTISTEEAVGIAIAVIIILLICVFVGFFFYKKNKMMIAKPTEFDLGSVESKASYPGASPGGEAEMNKV